MENSSFVARLVPEKKNYKEFGRIHMKKSKLFLLYLILGIVLYAVQFCLVAFAGIEVGNFVITLAYLLIFYCLFMGDFIGASSFRAINKKLHGNAETFYFGETGFSIYSEMHTSNNSYDMIEAVYESPEIFALYIGKNTAQIIPKSAFVEGDAEGFHHYIGEKTNKQVKVVSTSDRTALKVVAAVLIFAAMMGGILLSDALYNHIEATAENQIYTYQDYSVTLPDRFSEIDVEDYAYALESRDAFIAVDNELFSEVAEYLEEAVTLQSYVAAVMEYNDITADMREKSTDGSARFSYYVEDDGEEYFYYFVINEGNDEFWLTNFCCESSNADKYFDQFVTWADSIAVK